MGFVVVLVSNFYTVIVGTQWLPGRCGVGHQLHSLCMTVLVDVYSEKTSVKQHNLIMKYKLIFMSS